MQYDSNKAGKYYIKRDGEIYTYNAQGRLAYAGGTTGENTVVLLTGYYITTQAGNTDYQIVGGGYVNLSEGWSEYGTGVVTGYSQTQAQVLVNTIIANNKKIISNNILCARFANKLTAEQQKQLYDLQIRLQQRNQALLKDGVCTNLQTSYPEGYVYLQTYLDTFMAQGAIGIAVSTIVTIVVVATVVAGLGTAAYYAYKDLRDESANDVKYSDQLTKILTDKLTSDEYQQLLQETQGIVTKSKIKASLSSYGTIIKYALVAAAGMAAFYYVNNQLKK